MRPRRAVKLYSLVRPRVRQSMNKRNLYNLWRLRIPSTDSRTFFQQKWTARSLLRGYHGEHISETKWTRLFDRRLASVVDLSPRYLAEHDGSEQAAGRGSGRDDGQTPTANAFASGTGDKKGRGPQITPYMAMTFAPMERRLDIAVFRALFASSARQARQMIVHGRVKVNGQKMKYPGYLLNPGDMFQVDPEAILLATGKSKKGSSKTSESGDDGEASSKPLAADLWDVVKRTESLLTSIQESNEASSSSTDPPLNKHAARAAENSPSSLSLTDEHRAELGSLVRRAGRAVARRMRAQSTMPPEARNRSAMDDLVDALADLDLGRLPVESRIPEEEEGAEVAPEKVEAAETAAEKPTSDAVAAATEASNEANEPVVKTAANETEAETSAPDSDGAAKADSDAPTSVTTKSTATAEVTPLTPRLLASLRSLVLRALQNPYDPSKPYATPWRPRPYMPAFAFVPRYLEVDPLIGAAVYLRHPVARPGRAEVPTPFPLAQNQLAFNWYLRRR